MRLFLVALQFLTVFPWPSHRQITEQEIGRSSSLFPLVGFCLGLVLVFFNRLLESYMPSGILSVILVALLVLMTRALHLDGLGDTFDGLGAKAGPEEALRVMRDSHTGIFGLLAVVIAIGLKVQALEFMGPGRDQALLIAPTLGRWAMVVLAYGSRSAREGLGRFMVDYVRGRHLFFATVIVLALAFAFAGRGGLWIALGISIFTLVCRLSFHRCLGGVTGDTFGAVGEMTETLALVVFALIEWNQLKFGG